MTWDPTHYLTYADERGRPFFDLLARVGAVRPRTVADLGCGPGNLTVALAARWPGAQILGLDSSPEMIRAAPHGQGVDFEVRDLRSWIADADPVDVVVSNATLQWVEAHLDLLPQLAARAGQWLAFQVPGNFDEPSHTIRTDLASRPEFAVHLNEVAVPSSHDPADYHRALAPLGFEVDAWETTYLHVLHGPDAVFDWVSSTGARPTIEALPAGLREEFVDEFRARLRDAYPEGEGGVLLPFRRIFVVAHRAES
ncbi:MAG TPA: methyltransferase domain-containing protein [Nocardioides sp.]|jgi:trans-aconitate 2-methyltransferase